MKKLSFNGLTLLAGLIFVQAAWTNAWANNGCTASADPKESISCNSVASDPSCYKSYGYNSMNNCAENCRSPWVMGGWTEAGLFVNEYGQKNSYNAGEFMSLSGNTDHLNNVRQSDLQVNQTWLYFGKELTSYSQFQIGGRVDFMYGTDRFLQSDGFERRTGHDPWGDGDYYAAFPQAYAEIGNKMFSIKAGKFLGLLGYESGMSPDRFFYSLSRSYAIVPATMTGTVATWNPSGRWSFFGGWISGRNSTFDSSQDSDFVGGFKYQLTKRLSIGYGTIIGKEQDISPYFAPESDVYVSSLVLNYKPTDRWNYTFAWNLQNQTDKQSDLHWGMYTLTNELTYRINHCWSIGTRAEWVKTHNDGVYGASDEFTDLSLGANWTPTCWLLVRPELRYDSIQNTPVFGGIKSGVPKRDQLSGGFSCIVKY